MLEVREFYTTVRKMTNYPETRKSPVRLTADQEYTIYKYCVEHNCLKQADDMFSFRVTPTEVAKEINLGYSKIAEGKAISAYHIRSAVESVIGWQTRLQKIPTAPIETVEIEQLKEAKIKLVKEVEEYKLLHSQECAKTKKLAEEVSRLAQIKTDAEAILNHIKKIIGV